MSTSANDRRPTDVRLYTQAQNPFSEKVAAALALKGIPFERVVSDDPADVVRWSPIARTLPVLEIDGVRKVGSLAIVEWIDVLVPEPPLYAADPRTAAAQRSLAEWADDSFLWYWNRWRAARQPRMDDADAPAPRRPMAKLLQRVERRFGLSPRPRADAREREIVAEIEARLDDLVGFLGTRVYFHGDSPSVADLSVNSFLTILRAGAIPACDEAVEARPTLVAFNERMATRIAAQIR